MVVWELRYRSPRTIDNVQIETFTESEEEAKALADRHLATLASPSIRFVALRRIVVARSSEHPDLVEQYKGKPIKSAPTPAAEEPEEPSRPNRPPGARVGA